MLYSMNEAMGHAPKDAEIVHEPPEAAKALPGAVVPGGFVGNGSVSSEVDGLLDELDLEGGGGGVGREKGGGEV